ncbi:hypothetical protein, partial [Cetobacterium sp.]|uniref:hypothetical protein n=1 Tax=Cetobacterium sp. TaxID=2071632 RepID=UPI002FCC1C26
MGKLDLLNAKIRKKKLEIKRLQRSSTEKRKTRKIKLIKLGTLFNVADLLDEPQETMIAFLEQYKKLSIKEKEEYNLKGQEILFNTPKESYDPNKKKMFYRMIRKSALLEKLKIHLENPNILMGYISIYKTLTEKQKEDYFIEGKKLFRNSYKKLEKEIISDTEKLELLKLSFEVKIYLTNLLKINFKKYINN